jgi:hypothetical protein
MHAVSVKCACRAVPKTSFQTPLEAVALAEIL